MPVVTVYLLPTLLEKKYLPMVNRFKNLSLKKGESVSFRYRIIVDEGKETISEATLNSAADEFGKSK